MKIPFTTTRRGMLLVTHFDKPVTILNGDIVTIKSEYSGEELKVTSVELKRKKK